MEGPEGPGPAPVGGGVAWPDNELTRRAKLAARTARGRAATHRHTQRQGPPTPATPVGPQQHVASYNTHPHSWSQPTKIPTFPYQKAEKSRS